MVVSVQVGFSGLYAGAACWAVFGVLARVVAQACFVKESPKCTKAESKELATLVVVASRRHLHGMLLGVRLHVGEERAAVTQTFGGPTGSGGSALGHRRAPRAREGDGGGSWESIGGG
ncbi:unnamed protein product [Prorocentrum cordatum]|uniref:Uncharacterized protein n=1 Tax=Prorocentrum cordatum TaxID=2364126 RepID=A0ABN9Y1B8_9DINO|nr:unnamed protein product [Polarella glacialis]